jgi:hypothetical protein
MLTEGSTDLTVREPGGEVRGYLTLEGVSRLLAGGPEEAVR